jgi:integral membrane protein
MAQALASGRSIEVMRQWVTPRALMLHAAFAAIATGCLIAAWWQIHRAMAGNTLSYLYSVEWPAFVVVAGIGWWQMVHDTPEDIARRKAHHARARVASAEVVARTLPRAALAITVETSDVDNRRRLAASASGSTPGINGPEVNGPQIDAPGPTSPVDLPVRRGGSSVPDEVVTAALLAGEADEDQPADDMTAYNRYLALLAVRGKAKTWRNPRGNLSGTSGALIRYRVMAYIVGVMLLVVFASIPFDSVEKVVGPIHGALYIVYLLTALDLVRRTRLGFWPLAAMVAGGWVPFLAFVVERWVSRRLTAAGVT